MAADVSIKKTSAFSQRPNTGRWLKLFPLVTLAAFMLPILAGILGTLLPAFHFLPALGGNHLSLEPWRQLVAYPGIWHASLLSLATGLTASLLSFAIVCLITASLYQTSAFARLRRVLGPFLAVPHTALAVGFLFLFSPSGWIVRTLSPWATGWDRPADLTLSPDPAGVSLVAALVLKEVPFLLLMTIGALGQIPTKQNLAVARSLGYRPGEAWLKTILPQIYGRLRLPVYAVIAFSVSVVDVALILTPTTSPTLGILILRWFNDPDLDQQFMAAAGACLQSLLVMAAIGLWWLLERGVILMGRWRLERGTRDNRFTGSSVWLLVGGLMALTASACMAVLALWSLTRRWRFPDTLPSQWTAMNWSRYADQLTGPAASTLIIGLAATAIALVMTLGCLETEKRHGIRPGTKALWLLYLPLLIPQTAFLFGAQVLLVASGWDGSLAAVVWSHLLFVLPYVFLSLSESYRGLDDRYARSALCLGAGPGRVFWRIKIPMLLRPILVAMAVGFAVSVAQYLPTIFAGAGRYATLTTETVSLASGGDRRLAGLFAFLQAMLPLAGFWIAIGIPNWIYRHRRGMKGEA
ncbi:ABC transporter permease [Aestuariispira insulae]|uniref:Putative thiamine transport system permease protein n=1 Tax=Aestuariispira insulae TaxID=1461337 RepID=A0A3D9HP09_9PROT|nr:ABC transporter permease subunit [Aestuariispira insulae]RED51234.1 putative thiamine transport system permease protein [Aestuariispira insulae]